MGTFPNASTQFVGGERRGLPRPMIGRRKARRLKVAVAISEAVLGPAPTFEGDSLDYLRAVMKGEIQPDPARMQAAIALSRFEHPMLAASAVSVAGTGMTLEQLVLGAQQRNRIEAMSHDERLAHAQGLLDRARSTIGTPLGKIIDAEPAPPSTDTSAAEMKASIARAEQEAAEIRAELAAREASRDHDAEHRARLRAAGIGFLQAGQRR